MNTFESLFFWVTTLLLAIAFFLTLLSILFHRPWSVRVARILGILAFITLTVFGAARWVRTGHPPFVTLFESMTISVWFVLLMFHALRARLPQVSILLLPVSGIAFLLMGWSSSLSQEASPLSAALTSTWLFIHASFATAGAAAFLIGASFSIVYLMGSKKLDSMRKTLTALPEYEALPKSILNFLIFGLILWGVMIVSGSIWAHVAWGRYWAWDPIELWSLISWLLYGLLLHARLAFRLPKRLFCWLTILAAATIAFSLWGVHYVYETIHSYG